MPLDHSYSDRVRVQLAESAQLKKLVAEKCLDSILSAADLLSNTFRSGGKVLLCGNGGSAADCQHMAAEFVSKLTKNFERPALAAIALNTDTSILTAYSNDCGFDGIFARQVEALGRTGDALIGISTSGDSLNVIRAVDEAKKTGMRIVALTDQGGKMPLIADVAIAVPSSNTGHIQEAHLTIEHIVCYLVEQYLFGSSTDR